MSEKKTLALLESFLLEEITSNEAINLIQEIRNKNKSENETPKLNSIFRLTRVKKDLDYGTCSWEDFLANLRQVMLYYKTDLPLSKKIIHQIKDKYNKFNLFLYEEQKHIKVLPEKYPKWFLSKEDGSKDLKVINNLYDLQKKRTDNKVIGDGILYEMTGFTHYISMQQKAIVQACMDLPEGYTLLGCLPTGGGKSLASLLPAYFDNEGGTIGAMIEQAGLNIAVVPTVALAMDQVKNARKFFAKARNEKHKPQAYHGGLTDQDKKAIFTGLREGTIPLLYTSPEALMTGALKEIIFDLAQAKQINRLIIDEAHIVGSWGNIFRTEFQMLSVFQKKLYQYTEGKLRTVLLSATITDKTTKLLKELFVKENNLVEMRGDKLRPEPSFWLDNNNIKDDRYKKIIKLINLLPRPIILYVTKIDDAREWYQRLFEYGYKAVATFTGQTNKNRREELLEDWAADKIDIMISTSAFGLGVDKKDVRTVIHCCLPESIDRYYQEVGRAGRDGYPSLSIISTYYSDFDDENDYRVAKYLIDRILTTENIVARWQTMYENPVAKISGDEILIDTDVSPPHLEDKITGMRNANWNEVTLLFLYRNGLIDIQDIRKPKDKSTYQFEVKLKEIDTFIDKEVFRKKISHLRQIEQKENYAEYKDMKELLNEPENYCWGHNFCKIYSYTYLVCGGCPYCRRKSNYNYEDVNTEIYVKNPYELMQDREFKLTGKISEYKGSNSEIIIDYASKNEEYYKLVKELVRSNIKNIIFPNEIEEDWDKFLKYLPGENYNYYKTFQMAEIMNFLNGYSVFGPTAVYYSADKHDSKKIFNWTRNYLSKSNNNQLIHIASKDLQFANSIKKLKDRIEGDWVKIDNITSPTADDYETWL